MASRIAVLAIIALLAAGSAAASRDRTTASTTTIACGQRRIDVYFWPRGNAAIPALHFTADRTPHAYVYRAKRLGASAFVGYAGITQIAFARTCRQRASSGRPTWAGGRSRRTTSRLRLRCSFPTAVEFRATPLTSRGGRTNGNRLDFTLGHTGRTVLQISIAKARRSRLRFSRASCRTVPIPAGRA